MAGIANSRFSSVHLFATVLALGLVACGSAETNGFPSQVEPGAELSVTPPSARVGPGQSVAFSATAAGAVAAQITWSIQEGAAGGTVTADGLYTAPSLNGTFHVVAVSSLDPAKSGSAAIVVSGQPPPATGAPMTTANRSTGVAPLSVFFDAVDTVPDGTVSPFSWTSGVMQPPDGDYEGLSYSWDFGDAASGVWTTTGLSRNRASGYTAAHVYELPGVYTASLTVTDKAGTVYTYKQTITVTEFSGTTYYVSAAGNDSSNDGLSQATPFQSATKALSMLGTNRRILFRRGDTFPMGTVTVTAAGPGIIGAYGSGNRPALVTDTTSGAAFTMRGADWRIVDIELPGPNGAGSSAVQYDVGASVNNTLLLRVSAPNWRVGLGWAAGQALPHDGSTVMECEVATPEVNGMYVGGRRLAMLGNNIHDPATSHVLRVWQAHKAVISNNRLWNPGPTRHALKLHGPAFGSGWPETRWVTISDNLIRGKVWSVAIGPQDAGKDERVSHVVFERNRTSGESSIQVDLEIWARQVMIRNNVFNGTGSTANWGAITVEQRGIEPPSQDVRVLNNTVIRTDVAGNFDALATSSVTQNVTFRNNLLCAPLASNAALTSGTPGASFVSDHNLVTVASAFTDFAGGDLTLPVGSPAVDAGVTQADVHDDYLGSARPLGSGYDLGAHESR